MIAQEIRAIYMNTCNLHSHNHINIDRKHKLHHDDYLVCLWTGYWVCYRKESILQCSVEVKAHWLGNIPAIDAIALILTDLTLHPKHFRNLVEADQRRVSDVLQDAGQNAGSKRPARKKACDIACRVLTHSFSLYHDRYPGPIPGTPNVGWECAMVPCILVNTIL